MFKERNGFVRRHIPIDVSPELFPKPNLGFYRRLTLHDLLHQHGIGIGRMPSEPERAVRGQARQFRAIETEFIF